MEKILDCIPIKSIDIHYQINVDMYKEAYMYPIYEINFEELRGESLYIPPLSPNFGRRLAKGRKVTKRRREDGESERKKKKCTRLKRQQTIVTCNKYGSKGHNSATCTGQRREDGGESTNTTSKREKTQAVGTQPKQRTRFVVNRKVKIGGSGSALVDVNKDSHFTTRSMPSNPMLCKKIIEEGGRKFLDLSSRGSSADKKGKKKAT
ncbi:hypothetical protein ACS0TY_027591 [Phlomoides rotata]